MFSKNYSFIGGSPLQKSIMSRGKGALTVADRDAIENPSSFREEKRTPNPILLSSSKRVFVLCLAMRMLNSLLVQTQFNPDEHWQALEVAHRITFGYPKFDQVLLMNVTPISFYLLPSSRSHSTSYQTHVLLLLINDIYGHLAWEWKKGIWGYLHPMLFGFLYKVLEVLCLDTPLFTVNLLSCIWGSGVIVFDCIL